MKKILLIVLLLGVPFSAFALNLGEAIITTDIVNREPVDRIETYPAQSGKLYCLTRVEGASGETQIEHVWLFEGREMARVALPIRSSRWRTFSSKRILPEWKGNWQVQVLDASGTEIGSVVFRVE